MTRRKQCPCGAPRLPGIDECRACQIRGWYRHTHQVLRLARCGALDRETALGEAQTAREEVRMLRRGAA